MIPQVLRSPPHSLLGALCLGIALANVIRLPTEAALAGLGVAGALAVAASWRGIAAATCLLALGGWWWGSARLERLDHSILRSQVGRAERAQV
ncbi:MAG TPA: hypothetical protein VGJ58_00895, partial [Gaiellaceae bacterium]